MRVLARAPALTALAVLGALALALPGLGAAPAHAEFRSDSCALDTGSYTDLDLDGKADHVVGIPGEDLDGVKDAGRIEIHYGNGTMQGMHMPHPQAGDRFGQSVTSFAIGTGPCIGLAVGAPGHDVGGAAGAGAVALFWRGTGDVGKLVYSKTLDQGFLAGTPQAHAGFGTSLSAAASNTGEDEPTTDVYIGAPGYTVDGKSGAGAVVRENLGQSTGLIENSAGTLLAEGSAPIGGTAGAHDAFGTSIGTGGEVIGAPGKDVGGALDAGAAYVRTGVDPVTYREVDEDTEGVPGSAEAGDLFGWAVLFADDFGTPTVAIGAPGEAVGSVPGAGAVTYVDVDETGPVTGSFHRQGAGGVPGTPERDDHFGQALGVELSHGILVGVPDEDVGSAKDAGAVDQPGRGSHGPLAWSEDTRYVPGSAEAGDRFGASFGVVGARVLVGDPGEDAGAGRVVDGLPGLDGSPVAVPQGSGGAEAGDGFGTATTTGYGVSP